MLLYKREYHLVCFIQESLTVRQHNSSTQATPRVFNVQAITIVYDINLIASSTIYCVIVDVLVNGVIYTVRVMLLDMARAISAYFSLRCYWCGARLLEQPSVVLDGS